MFFLVFIHFDALLSLKLAFNEHQSMFSLEFIVYRNEIVFLHIMLFLGTFTIIFQLEKYEWNI